MPANCPCGCANWICVLRRVRRRIPLQMRIIFGFSSAFRISIETLKASPLRTFLSILGIVIGVASLVAVLSLSDGMQRFIHEQLDSTADLQLMRVSPLVARDVDGAQIPLPDTVRFTSGDVHEMRAYLGDSIAVGLVENAIALATGTKQHAVHILGISAPLLFALQIRVESGRMFSDADGSAPVVLLSKEAAHELAPPRHAALVPRDTVRLNGTNHTVLGILGGRPGGKTIFAVMPIASAQNVVLSSGGGSPPAILIHAATIESVSATRTLAERWEQSPVSHCLLVESASGMSYLPQSRSARARSGCGVRSVQRAVTSLHSFSPRRSRYRRSVVSPESYWVQLAPMGSWPSFAQGPTRLFTPSFRSAPCSSRLRRQSLSEFRLDSTPRCRPHGSVPLMRYGMSDGGITPEMTVSIIPIQRRG